MYSSMPLAHLGQVLCVVALGQVVNLQVLCANLQDSWDLLLIEVKFFFLLLKEIEILSIYIYIYICDKL